MKSVFIKTAITAAILLLGVTAHSQTGTWSGSIDVRGNKLTLVFNITADAVTLDVPDQGARGIPAEMSRTALGTLKISVPAIAAVYEGYYVGNVISGNFSQSGMSFPLTLKPGVPALNRPQTPQPPFPYTTEEVSFTNGGATLAGTLTLPAKADAGTPVLVMVTGSGQQNRDEEIFEHKPFAVIADAFARKGIATLRYDDRGTGQSSGELATATTADFCADALAGIKLLRPRFKHVGVLGHSEGGTIALMLAASGEVDFAVSMAGMVVSGSETMLLQTRHGLLKAGISASDTDEYCRLVKDTFDAITSGGQLPSVGVYDIPEVLRKNYAAAVKQYCLPWMKYFLGLDVRPLLPQIKCPVLALNGSLDTQVDAGLNLGALREAGNGNIAIKTVGGVNHLFQPCKTGETVEYKQIETTVSPEVLDCMTSWISSLGNLAK